MDREKIYIDFKYQGIPEELDIVAIKPFDLSVRDQQLSVSEKLDKAAEDNEENIYDED